MKFISKKLYTSIPKMLIFGMFALLPLVTLATLTLKGNVLFDKNLTVLGLLSKGGGSFVIDDPIDPANKLLYHSFVESPDAMNIYDGIATLDSNGEATIQLPNYFEALNKDFRYQYESIGQPAPGLYIKSEIKDNQFVIAGGPANGKVSWQVTGVRHDPFIEAHPIVPIVEKGPNALVKKGQYLFKGYESSSTAATSSGGN